MKTWCNLLLIGPGGEPRVSWVVSGVGHPDLSVVEGLAWLRLAARRRGDRVVVSDPDPELIDLLELVGLAREVQGQPEQREDPLAVEEAVEPADPPC